MWYRAPGKRYGMTDPISMDAPTPADIESTEKLQKILRDDFDLFETEAESQHREEVLGRLDQIAKEWVKAVSLRKVDCAFLLACLPEWSLSPTRTRWTHRASQSRLPLNQEPRFSPLAHTALA